MFSIPSLLAPRALPLSRPLPARAVRRIVPLGLVAAAAAAVLSGCGGGGGGDTAPPPGATHQTLGLSVTGLAAGQSVVVQNNGADDFAVAANGLVRTAASWPLGSSYAVTVKTQPTGQRCTVARGTGTLAADSPAVQVDCAPLPSDRTTLGGSISGLFNGSTVVLTTGGEDLALTADGGFTFPTPLATGAAYAVTVKTKPVGLGCVVRNGAGTITAAAVDPVAVRCASLGSLASGFWEQDQCLPGPGGTGLKNGWRLSHGRPALLTFDAGSVSYRNAQCTGVGTVAAGPLPGGFTTIMMDQDMDSELSATWVSGELMSPPSKPMVLVRKDNHLCLLDNTATPSAYPNAASTANAVTAAIAAGTCYTPR
jgi:hypothetical protein